MKNSKQYIFDIAAHTRYLSDKLEVKILNKFIELAGKLDVTDDLATRKKIRREYISFVQLEQKRFRLQVSRVRFAGRKIVRAKTDDLFKKSGGL